MHTIIRDAATATHDFIFYADRLIRLVSIYMYFMSFLLYGSHGSLNFPVENRLSSMVLVIFRSRKSRSLLLLVSSIAQFLSSYSSWYSCSAYELPLQTQWGYILQENVAKYKADGS
jgi:hypothetical protein